MYVQLFGRPRTGEMRLIGGRRPDGSYSLKSYDIEAIEDKLAVFNTVYRSHARFAHGDRDGGYESVAEFAILCGCCRVLGSHTPSEQAAMHGKIKALLATYIVKDVWTCPFHTLLAGAARPVTEDVAVFVREWIARIQRERPGKLPRELVDRVRAFLDR